MTIGHEFAMRWLDKNAPIRSLDRTPSIDTVDFCGDVAAAVDAYADECRAQFDAVLRRVFRAAMDEPGNSECVRVNAADLLKSESMTRLAYEMFGGFERPRRFPVSLHS